MRCVTSYNKFRHDDDDEDEYRVDRVRVGVRVRTVASLKTFILIVVYLNMCSSLTITYVFS